MDYFKNKNENYSMMIKICLKGEKNGVKMPMRDDQDVEEKKNYKTNI